MSTDWRITACTGVASRPPTNAAPSSTGYASPGANAQNTPATTRVRASIVRRSRRSTSLPISGAPTPMPTVLAATTSPAAAYPRPICSTTCNVRVIAVAVAGMRTRNATGMSLRSDGTASTAR